MLGDLDFEVIGQMENGDDLVRRVRGLRPDLALVDIRMPPTHTDEGLLAAQAIGEEQPDIGVVILSQYLEASYAMRLLEEGTAGRGYLLKDRVGDLKTFAESLRRVGAGGSVVDPKVVASLVGRRRETSPLEALSVREQEILSMMAEGRSNQGICERLVVSPRTVESHVRTIFQKLDLAPAEDDHRRVLAALAFLKASAER